MTWLKKIACYALFFNAYIIFIHFIAFLKFGHIPRGIGAERIIQFPVALLVFKTILEIAYIPACTLGMFIFLHLLFTKRQQLYRLRYWAALFVFNMGIFIFYATNLREYFLWYFD